VTTVQNNDMPEPHVVLAESAVEPDIVRPTETGREVGT
jgi:hypothetical protein